MNIKEIAERAYLNAGRLGKLGNRDKSDMLTDIFREYQEAWNAFHTGRFENIEAFLLESEFESEDKEKELFEFFVKDTYEDELIDILFVVLTLLKDNGVDDIEKHIEAKMKYNELREDHKAP